MFYNFHKISNCFRMTSIAYKNESNTVPNQVSKLSYYNYKLLIITALI
jgi:hypothetical protein